VIFSIISLTSIVGTIIEQQAEPARNIKLLTKFFGESLAPTLFKVLDAMALPICSVHGGSMGFSFYSHPT